MHSIAVKIPGSVKDVRKDRQPMLDLVISDFQLDGYGRLLDASGVIE